MYEKNPREIDVGPSEHEVQVSEGSSYRELTVVIFKPKGLMERRGGDPDPPSYPFLAATTASLQVVKPSCSLSPC